MLYRGGRYFWNTPNNHIKKTQRNVFRSYQKWYSTALHLIKENLDDERSKEFTDYYPLIKDYLQFKSSLYKPNKDAYIDQFVNTFDTQIGILSSIPDVLETQELRFRELISAVYVELEIDQAEILLITDLSRAAGALVGVALEKHLETMCFVNNIQYSHKETINPLATKLYTNNVIDITELKKIEYFASIRNKCDHPNNITKNEVKELIDGVKKLT